MTHDWNNVTYNYTGTQHDVLQARCYTCTKHLTNFCLYIYDSTFLVDKAEKLSRNSHHRYSTTAHTKLPCSEYLELRCILLPMNWLTKLTELACYGLTHCAVAAHLSDCACQSTWFCCNSDLCNINTAANYGPPEPTHIADRSRYFGVMGWNNLIDRSRSYDVSETIVCVCVCVCVAPVIAAGLCNVCLGVWRVLQTPTRGTRPTFGRSQ